MADDNSYKVYYSIGEVASMLGVNTSLIRFWEKEFDDIKPKKNKKGSRLYTKHDIETIKNIHFLLKECGYTIAGARECLKTQSMSEVYERKQLIASLESIKKFLVNIKRNLPAT